MRISTQGKLSCVLKHVERAIVRFGKIWVYMRSRSVYTVQEYEAHLRMVFDKTGKKREMNFDVVDIFAIPNYHAWFDGCIDQDLSK
jgi:hypothetical protein